MQNLNSALNTWNEKLAEIWTLLTQSPESFKGGDIWSVITGINGALTAIGYGLLVLFFAAGIVKTCGSFGQTKSAYSPGRDSPDRGGRWLSRLVFPWAFISKICLPYSSIFIYFLDIAKPPRVVLLSYTGRLFIYCLLFTDRFRLSFRRAYYICLIFFSLSIPHKLLRVSS